MAKQTVVASNWNGRKDYKHQIIKWSKKFMSKKNYRNKKKIQMRHYSLKKII